MRALELRRRPGGATRCKRTRRPLAGGSVPSRHLNDQAAGVDSGPPARNRPRAESASLAAEREPAPDGLHDGGDCLERCGAVHRSRGRGAGPVTAPPLPGGTGGGAAGITGGPVNGRRPRTRNPGSPAGRDGPGTCSARPNPRGCAGPTKLQREAGRAENGKRLLVLGTSLFAAPR